MIGDNLIKQYKEYNNPHFGVMASGISGNLTSPNDFTEDFATATNWTTYGSLNGISSSRLNYDGKPMNGTNNSVVRALVENASDTTWYLNFDITFSNIGGEIIRGVVGYLSDYLTMVQM